MQGARTYAVVARVHGAETRDAETQEIAGCVWKNCARGKRHAFFASMVEEDTLGEGDALLEVNGKSAAEVYTALSKDLLQRFVLEVARAGLTGEKFGDAAHVKYALERISKLVLGESWTYEESDVSETAMQTEVRMVLTRQLYNNLGLPLSMSTELVDCLVRAAPVVRAVEGGAPVFAVEACAEGAGQCWAVTSYFPEPMRHTAFAGVPVSVRSAGGLWYDVAVMETAAPRQTLVV